MVSALRCLSLNYVLIAVPFFQSRRLSPASVEGLLKVPHLIRLRAQAPGCQPATRCKGKESSVLAPWEFLATLGASSPC